MSDRLLPIDGVDIRRVFPWVQLLRSFRLALRVRQILLGALGVWLTIAGLRLLDHWFTPAPETNLVERPATMHQWPWQSDLGFSNQLGRQTNGNAAPSNESNNDPCDTVETVYRGISRPSDLLTTVFSNFQVTLSPLRELITLATDLFRTNTSFGTLGVVALKSIWWLIVWGLMGGAISRSAAVEFARDQSTHFWGALKFSAIRFLSYLSAPLLPLAGIFLLAALCAMAGVTGRIAVVGPFAIGMLWGAVLIIGLILAVAIMGLATGWPLMFACVSVEGTDGFDGMSRAYNYVYERPLYYLWQVILSLGYGSFAAFCVLFMAQLCLRMAVWGTAFGSDPQILIQIVDHAPPLLLPDPDLLLPDPSPSLDLPVSSERANGTVIDPASGEQLPWWLSLARFWMCVLANLVFGFVAAHFWCSVTVNYFLLRRSVDGNDFDEVFIGTDPDPDELLPLVGSAAMGLDLATIGSPQPLGQSPPDNPPYAAPRSGPMTVS